MNQYTHSSRHSDTLQFLAQKQLEANQSIIFLPLQLQSWKQKQKLILRPSHTALQICLKSNNKFESRVYLMQNISI
jgi:hypothetical protein